MKHKHHIIPKHIGGSDDPTNLVKLTVEEHAEAHRLLWEEHGRWQDYCAWQSLSGQISCAEAIKMAQSKSNLGKKHTKEHHDKVTRSKIKNGTLKHTQETKNKISDSLIGNVRAKNTKRSDDWKEKYKGSKSGEKNGMYNKSHSQETKNKLSILKEKRIVIDDIVFQSGKIASLHYNVTSATISYWLKTGKAKKLHE